MIGSASPHPELVQTLRRMRRDARSAGEDAPTPTAVMAAINYVIDGGGTAITTGNKGGLIIPFACRIKKVELQEMDGTAGTLTVDIQKSATGIAPVFVSIVGATPPSITVSGHYYFDEAWAPTLGLTGWTTLINKGDALRYVVDAATSIQRVTVMLHVQRLDLTG